MLRGTGPETKKQIQSRFEFAGAAALDSVKNRSKFFLVYCGLKRFNPLHAAWKYFLGHPSSTRPICVSMHVAETPFEDLGTSWDFWFANYSLLALLSRPLCWKTLNPLPIGSLSFPLKDGLLEGTLKTAPPARAIRHVT